MILFENICIGIALAVLVLFILLAIRFRRTATKRFSLVLVGICVSCFFLSPVSGIWGLIEGIMLLCGKVTTDGKGNTLA